MITFVTVNFNTPLLCTALCSSICKNHNDCQIVVFDNSTDKPLEKKIVNHFNIKYYDNTNNAIIDFDTVFKSLNIPIHEKFVKINNLGSAKHTFTIDWLLYHLPYNDIILMDSDTLLKRHIDFDNALSLTAGTVNTKEQSACIDRMPRLLPYCQYFNLVELRRRNLHYFHPGYMMGFLECQQNYDTGVYFYESCVRQYPQYCNTAIDIDDYIVHYKAGSWKVRSSIEEWLYRYKALWMR